MLRYVTLLAVAVCFTGCHAILPLSGTREETPGPDGEDGAAGDGGEAHDASASDVDKGTPVDLPGPDQLPPGWCLTHADCPKGTLSSGVCDRSQAHLSGHGTCVDPAAVVELGGVVTSLTQAVNEVLGNATRTHVWLAPKTTHDVPSGLHVNGPGNAVTIVGDGSPTITSSSGSSVVVATDSGAVTLQGLQVTDQAYGSNGASCYDGGSLTILESRIFSNTKSGVITGGDCALEVRRSVVEGNDLGGLELLANSNGNSQAVIVNNVIVNNGGPGSTVGGISLDWWSAATPVVYNNTVADNQAKPGQPGGINCFASGAINIHNTIVWGNGLLNASSTCAFTTSDVEGEALTINAPPKLNADYTLQTDSPCIDTGSKVSVTVLDHLNQPRQQGIEVDMGAYEQ